MTHQRRKAEPGLEDDGIHTASQHAVSTPGIRVFDVNDNSARAPSDYVDTTGIVTFAANQLTQTIQVRVNGDAVKEANETFRVILSSPTNSTVVDNSALGTITNDDLR